MEMTPSNHRSYVDAVDVELYMHIYIYIYIYKLCVQLCTTIYNIYGVPQTTYYIQCVMYSVLYIMYTISYTLYAIVLLSKSNDLYRNVWACLVHPMICIEMYAFTQ